MMSGLNSPCSKNCNIIMGTHQCRVCKLTQKEKEHWGKMPNDDRLDILQDLKTRKLDDPYTIQSGYSDA